VNGEHKGKTSVEESSATNTTKSTKMKSLINNDNISSVNEENLNSKHPTSEDNTKAKGLKEKVKEEPLPLLEATPPPTLPSAVLMQYLIASVIWPYIK